MMFHGRQINNDKINKQHEKALRSNWSFQNLLIKDKSFTIHHQIIQSLVIEIFKAMKNLPGEILANSL